MTELRAIGFDNAEFQRLQDPDLPAAERQALINQHQTAFADLRANFDDGTIEAFVQRLGGKGFRQVYSATGNEGLKTVLNILELERQGRVTGFDDWVSFFNRSNAENRALADIVGELDVAKQTARGLQQGEIVNVGGDARAAAGRSGGQDKSFDITVENAQTTEVARNIEVQTVDGVATDVGFLLDGVGHAVGKAISADSGTVEAAIRVELPEPGTRIPDENGKVKYFGSNGRYVEIYETNNPNLELDNAERERIGRTDRIGRDTYAGELNLFEGLRQRLSRTSDFNVVDRVSVFDKNGSTIAVLNRANNGNWILENVR